MCGRSQKSDGVQDILAFYAGAEGIKERSEHAKWGVCFIYWKRKLFIAPQWGRFEIIS